MFRRTARVVAVVFVVVGLLFAMPYDSSAAPKKSKKTAAASKKSSKSKKDSKRGKKADKRSSSKKSSSKRSKRDTVARSKKSSRSTRDDRTSSRKRRETSRDVVSRKVTLDEDDDGTGDDAEPDAPKPANRLVADIATGRVIQIQNALIQKGLLVGPPTGVYDQPTFQAMASFQTRNGWNGVGYPTADSLKALGVPKNSGHGLYTPARVVEATAPQ